MSIIRKAIYPDFTQLSYKDNNFYEYSPYYIKSNQNVIDKEWWNSLTDYCKELISSRLNNDFILDKVEIPHETQLDSNKFLYTVYRSYIDSFDYQMWYPVNSNEEMKAMYSAKDVKIIKINDNIKHILIKKYFSEKLSENEEIELNEFCKIIEKNIDLDKKYFIRLSGTSGKNEKNIKYFTSTEDILYHLSSVKLFIEQEYKRIKPTYLIMMEWNESIDLKYEFRIFVYNKKITGISQQSKKLFNFTQDELDLIELSLNKFIESNIVENLPYDTFILDTYIHINQDKDGYCKIIEINPFGAHCGAGSSLFQWDKDFEVLHGNSDKVELRYLSIVNI